MWKLGKFEIDSKVVLAPMAGFTFRSYREFMANFDFGVCVTEMVSDMGLFYGNEETKTYIDFKKGNYLTGVQLFGHDPIYLKKAAEIALNANPDIDFFDVNMGCPVPKVVDSGSGSALMKNPKLCGNIIRAIKEVTDKPVTAKIRLGWDSKSINYLDVIRELEDAGVDMIAIHSRTKKELYLGEPNTGVLTGKGSTWGGSILRPEATGFGALYFTQDLLHKAGKDIAGCKVALSGFGNVAWGAATKALELGAKVVAISGPDGVCEMPDGITKEMIDYMLVMRASNRDRVEDMATRFPGQAFFTPGKKAWNVKCDIALPCAFQNELSEEDAKELKANGCWCCCEVSNMGCQPGAIHFFQHNGIYFAPGKAVNAGGVATSGLEMTQNASHISWSGKEVDEKLHFIMDSIHEACVKYGTQPDGSIDYVKGANIAGFMKVATAMLEQGII